MALNDRTGGSIQSGIFIDDVLYTIAHETASKRNIRIKVAGKESVSVWVSGEDKECELEYEFNEFYEGILDFDTKYSEKSDFTIKDKIIYLIKDKLIKSVKSNASDYL